MQAYTYVSRLGSSQNSGRRESTAAYLLVAPFVVSFVVFFALPSLYSITLSFFTYRGYGPATFVGLHNYQALLSLPSFWQAVGNMVFYYLVPIGPMLGGAFLLAVLVRSKLVRADWFFKPIVFMPQIMATVAAALVFHLLFADNGVVNEVLGRTIHWLGDPALMKWPVALLLVWEKTGWYFVVFLAGLTRISPELYEAAAVDGASAWQQLTRITVPLMRPIWLFAVVIYTINSLRMFNEPTLLLTGTGVISYVPSTGAPIMNVLLDQIQAGNFGLAASVGWMLFVVAAVLSLMQFKTLGQQADELA